MTQAMVSIGAALLCIGVIYGPIFSPEVESYGTRFYVTCVITALGVSIIIMTVYVGW